MRRTRTSALTLAALVALCLSASARAQGASSRCNAAMSAPVSFVQLPGHPFSTVSTPDGCWLFVSLNSSNPKSTNGVAVLGRAGGQITLKRVFQVEAEPTGMTITHDGKLLIAADGDYVVFLDVGRMIEGRGDPVLGYVKDADFAGSVYVNTTGDDRFLFVSDENAETVTVINLQRARAEGFKETAAVGKIPVGLAPIALTFSPDGRWLYTTSEIAPESFGWPVECKPEGADPATAKPRYAQGAIIVVDVQKAETDPAHSAVARVPAGCSPVRLAIAPDGGRVYVTARNNNALLAFDTAKLLSDAARARVGTVPVGSAPVGVAVVNGGRQVVITNSNRFSRDQTARQTLTVIDAARVGEGQAAIAGSVPAGIFPREFGQSPDGQTLYVANYNSNELEVIDLKRLQIQHATAAPTQTPALRSTAKDSGDDVEKEAIAKAVEAYLYGEKSGAKKDVLVDGVESEALPVLSGAHCLKVWRDSEYSAEVHDRSGSVKPPAVLKIDVNGGWGVATIFIGAMLSTAVSEPNARCQQVWLGKEDGVWKINTILLPEVVESSNAEKSSRNY